MLITHAALTSVLTCHIVQARRAAKERGGARKRQHNASDDTGDDVVSAKKPKKVGGKNGGAKGRGKTNWALDFGTPSMTEDGGLDCLDLPEGMCGIYKWRFTFVHT